MCHPGRRVHDVAAGESASSDYRAALTTRGALVPALFSAVGRLPVAMYALATLLYVQGATGSFAVAGLVSAGSLVGVALGSVVQGRLVDRLGPTRPLLAAAALFAGAVSALIVAVEAAAPLASGASARCGRRAVQPALPGASRALWGRLVPAGPKRAAAYNYEAISMEIFFILGPALAALLAAAPVAGHRAARGGDRHGRRHHRLRADPGRAGGEAGGAVRFRSACSACWRGPAC